MAISRAETVILAILQFFGFAISVYALWFQYSNNLSSKGMIHCFVWYILGGISHLLGLVSIALDSTENEEVKGNSMVVLQYHYLSGWLSVIIGYPLMVQYTWLMLYPTILAYAHVLLIIIPLLTWIGQSSHGIVRTTQVCSAIAAISHFVMCFLADDWWGWGSAVIMAINIIALSTPTKYHIWAFNSRELFVIGLVVTSYLMTTSIIGLSDPQRQKRMAQYRSN